MNGNVSYKFARIVTNLFVPPVNTFLVLTFLSVILFESKTDSLIALVISFLFSLAFPIIFFLWLRKKNLVADVDATNKDERTIPYLFGFVLCIIALIISFYLWGFILFSKIWLIYSINTLLLIRINHFWKISAHAIGVAAPIAILFFTVGDQALYLFLLLILIAWTRLYLKKHTISQIIAGSVFGFLLTYLQLLIL